MAKALVLSDSHGLTKRLDDIVNRHEVDLLIHCGDSELAHDSPHVNDFVIVKGNCDWDDAFEEEKIVEFERSEERRVGKECRSTMSRDQAAKRERRQDY